MSEENPAVSVDPRHWEALSAMDPDTVAARCACLWEAGKGYGVAFLGETYWVDPAEQRVGSMDGGAPLEAHLPLILVMYLLKAQERATEGRAITAREIPGGDLFFSHIHQLPTGSLEEAFGQRPRAFLRAGLSLGGRPMDTTPASFELLALPRVPVAFHLWPGDEEFPARCVITFDASIHKQLPLDIIWAMTQVVAQRLIARAEELDRSP